MDRSLQLRIDGVLARRRREQCLADVSEDKITHDRRVAREHVLSEVPVALAKLSSAVAEINDAVGGGGLHLTLEPSEETPTMEASFVVSLWPKAGPERPLVFNVSHAGKLIALLSAGPNRAHLKSVDIWAADRGFFLDVLVSLLENVA
jgi:hypothetical protein